MADNTILPPGTGGDTIRTIDRVTYKTQVIALDLGGEAGPESLVVGTVPVSGAFWQATQPVSAAALPLPAGAATAALQTTINTTLGSPLQAGGAVSVSNFPATQPVSGTFWQATQPISGTVAISGTPTVTVGNASIAVTGTFWQATQPVSGTFFQTTQPVSIATMPSTPVTGTFWQTTQPVSGTFWQATQPVSGTVTAAQATAASLNATVVFASAQPVTLTSTTITGTPAVSLASTTITGTVAVTAPTLTKGTQGANGFSVQALKDAGRNQTNYFMAAQVVSTATETLQSLTGYKSGALVTATTTPAVVTAGKTYHVQRITITSIAATAIGSIQVQLRANTGGVVAIGSPVVDSWVLGGTTSTFVAGDTETVNIDIPDGMEFAAGTGIGITVLGLAPAGTAQAGNYAKVSVVGYEY
jgi:hypothetical protein